MSQVTVSQLADVLGVEAEKLLSQLNDAGIEASGPDDSVSNDDKKKLLAHLRAVNPLNCQQELDLAMAANPLKLGPCRI